MTEQNYEIYVKAYGKVQSGTKLTNADYGIPSLEGLKAYDESGKMAVSLATQDVKTGKPMRSKSEFEEELKRLLS